MSCARRLFNLVVLGLVTSACPSSTTPAVPSCVYTLSRTSASLPAAGGTDTVSVSTGSACAWTAASSAAWLTIESGASGTGSGAVTFSAPANGPTARSATVSIAGQAVSVSQAQLSLPTFVLSGRVTDAFIGPGIGLSGVSVSVTSGPGQGSVQTDFAGRYTLSDLEAGTYEIAFARPSYVAGVATVQVAGPTSLAMSLGIDAPAVPARSDLTGNWSGTGTYPNAPFRLALVQAGTSLRGIYVDGLDASASVSGTFSLPDFTLRIDFGDAVLFLECTVEDARQISGVHRTSALGNRPYPFTMKR